MLNAHYIFTKALLAMKCDFFVEKSICYCCLWLCHLKVKQNNKRQHFCDLNLMWFDQRFCLYTQKWLWHTHEINLSKKRLLLTILGSFSRSAALFAKTASQSTFGFKSLTYTETVDLYNKQVDRKRRNIFRPIFEYFKWQKETTNKQTADCVTALCVPLSDFQKLFINNGNVWTYWCYLVSCCKFTVCNDFDANLFI